MPRQPSRGSRALRCTRPHEIACVACVRRQPVDDRGEDCVASVIHRDDVAVAFRPHQSPLGRGEKRERALSGVGWNAVVLTRLNDQRWTRDLRCRGTGTFDDARQLEHESRREKPIREVAVYLGRVTNGPLTAPSHVRNDGAKRVVSLRCTPKPRGHAQVGC